MKEAVERYKKAIAICLKAEDEKDNAEDALIEEIKKEKGTDHDLSLGYHDCEKSPTGQCVYDLDEDDSMDDCIYCREPDERK